MRRFADLIALAVAGAILSSWATPAAAAPPAIEPEKLAEQTGLVLVAFDQPNACPTNPWTAEVAAELAKRDARVVTVVRNSATIDTVLGEDAFRTKGMSVAFRDGTRTDVVCGCPDADDVVAWATALNEGGSWAAMRAATVADTKDRLDVAGHLEVSQRATCAGDLDTALDELVFLWTTLPEVMPEERVLRFNRVGRDMAVLARANEDVQARIGEMRDAIDPDSGVEALEEWIALNRVLLQDDKTVAWYDGAKDDAARSALVEHAAPSLFGMLTARKRWTDAGALIGDPLDWLADRKRAAGGLAMALEDHAALVAAGRFGDAKRLGLGVIKAMPDTPGVACQLISKSLEAGATHKSQAAIARKCDNPVVYEKWEKTL